MLMVAQADAEIGCFESKVFISSRRKARSRSRRPTATTPLPTRHGHLRGANAQPSRVALPPMPAWPARVTAKPRRRLPETVDRVAFTFDSNRTNSTQP